MRVAWQPLLLSCTVPLVVDSPPLEPGRIVAGRYRVESRIGEGGMGSVYLVRHVHTDESLALKVLHAHVLRDESAVERFRREARAPARIASEHVARVTDADTATDLDGAPFYVMELLRGRDLERVLVEDGPIAPVLLVEVLHQAARALDKAHAMGIEHRDLKPENLFLTHREDGTPCVKLLDFGIARLGGVAVGDHKTQAGYIFGTPGYMAPEQMVGDVAQIGAPTDVWALGLVAFKLLVGHDFFAAATVPELFGSVLRGALPSASERGSTRGPAFDAWFAGCVAIEAGKRYPSAGEAAERLADALSPHALAANFAAAAPLPNLPPRSAVFRSDPSIHRTVSALAAPELEHAAQHAPRPTRHPKGNAWGGAAIAVGLLVAAVASVASFAASGHGVPASSGRAPSAELPPSPTPEAPSEPVTSAHAARSSHGVGSSSTPAQPTGEARPHPKPADPPSDPRLSTDPLVPSSANDPLVLRAPPSIVSRDQQNRLSALQRLCDQGTVTAAECGAKRAAILRGEP